MSAALQQAWSQLFWGRPWAFALLPLSAGVGWLALRRVAHAAPADEPLHVHPDLFGLLQAPAPRPRATLHAVLLATAFACWVLALAQPELAGGWLPAAPRGRDVVVLLDTTLSMTLDDLRWNGRPAERLAVVKQVFAGFVRGSPGDRFGIIAYGARAATLLPPTFDRRLAVRMLARAHANLLGDGGCLGDAMSLALRQLGERAGDRQGPRGALRPVLVVYSDDGWTRGGQISPAQATALARALGVRVFTVQVGGRPADGRPYEVPAFDAPQPDLRDIARLTGGAYFYAADAGAQQRAVRAIAACAPTLRPPPSRRREHALYAWPLGCGVLLLAAAELASGFARRRGRT